MLFPDPIENFISELQVKFQKCLLLDLCVLNNRESTLAIVEVGESPSRGDHARNISTVSGGDGNFCDMWAKIEYEGVESCA